MSTEWTCFLFGVPATLIWAAGMRRGVMLGRIGRWVHRDEDALGFWFAGLFYGSIALGLLVAPLLKIFGLRD